ncbi:MAG: amidohydrolase family protein [Pseudomonadota bacterium]
MPEDTVRFVDAHHHLWNPVSADPEVGYVWLRDIGAPKPFGDPTPIQRDYGLGEFQRESQHTLVASVHVQADGAIPDPVAETRYVQALAESQPLPMAIVGFVNLSSRGAEAVLDGHAASPAFRGVRQIVAHLPSRPDISFSPRELLDDAGWRDRFTLLGERGLSFDLQAYPEQMPRYADFLAAHPTVPVAIDHCGCPWDQSPAGLDRWRSGISTLAALPQCRMKISGLGMYNANWARDNTRAVLDSLFEVFGPDRLMFGSNYPVEKLARPYDDVLADVVGAAREGGDQACRQVLETVASAFYRLDPSTD